MKRKLTKIFGVSLTLVMVLSLMMIFAPVAGAADYTENDWGTWGMPSIESDTDIGPMAVAPDGTLFAAVLDFSATDTDDWVFKVQKSDDNGYSWDDTEFEVDAWDGVWMEENGIVDIAIGENYEDDEILYVATYGGFVYRVEEAGDGDVIALKDYPDPNVEQLYSIDTWYDGDDNWVMAGTDEDVFVLRDAVFADWGDQDLDNNGFEVAFAPDFDDSELIWVITDSTAGDVWGDYVLTSTVSPGMWGLEIGEVTITGVGAYPWVDLGFPDNYDSDPDTGDTILFAALSSNSADGDVYLIEGVEAPGDSNAIALMDLAGEAFAGTSIVSIEVSGDYPDCVILAAALEKPAVYISDDGGDGWSGADKNPTGWYDFDPSIAGVPGYNYTVWGWGTFFSWTHVYMEADVVWGSDVFDVEESMSFVSTFGYESAVSRSDPNEDGDLVYNQVGNIDTEIDWIDDLGFHPDFPDTATYLMLTWDDTNSTSSLWLTENGDSDEPDYMRVLCGADWGYSPDVDPAPGNFDAELYLVEFSQDADAIYIHGLDDADGSVIWKSTDEGQTFGKRRVVRDDAWIYDWAITDSTTIYAATNLDGFYITTNSGLSWTGTDVGDDMNVIVLSPDFEDGEGFIALGGFDGEVLLSDDDGGAFDDTAAGLTGMVFVAFDADFADEDADGYMFIYAAGQGDDIQQGEVADTDDVDWDPLEDDQDEAAQAVFATGLQVAGDNALYALSSGGGAVAGDIEADGTLEIEGATTGGPDTIDILDTDITVTSGTFEDEESLTVTLADLTSPTLTTVTGTLYLEGDDSGATGNIPVSLTVPTGYTPLDDVDLTGYSLWAEVAGAVVAEDTGVFRLLLNESNSEWESADDTDLTNPMGLWLSLGSNVLWAIDMDGDADFYGELWVLEDTLSGQVTLDSPSSGYKSDYLDQMRVAWDEMRDADEYEVKYYHLPTGDSDVDDGIEDLDVLLKGLSASSEYEWKVRVSVGEPWHSRWSGLWSFHTALGAPPWAPTLYTPGGVWQYSGVAVELMPAFSWESAKSADGYQFMLADNAAFTSPLVNENVPESAYQLDFELEYNSNYFWKVMAYKGNDAISRWSDIGAFTTLEKAVPALTPAPPATVVQPAPAPIVLPTPIPPVLLWVIVGIGAALIIAVIILIVRTRRVV